MKLDWRYHNLVLQLHYTTCAQCRTSAARFKACRERTRLQAVADRALKRATERTTA